MPQVTPRRGFDGRAVLVSMRPNGLLVNVNQGAGDPAPPKLKISYATRSASHISS